MYVCFLLCVRTQRTKLRFPARMGWCPARRIETDSRTKICWLRIPTLRFKRCRFGRPYADLNLFFRLNTNQKYLFFVLLSFKTLDFHMNISYHTYMCIGPYRTNYPYWSKSCCTTSSRSKVCRTVRQYNFNYHHHRHCCHFYFHNYFKWFEKQLETSSYFSVAPVIHSVEILFPIIDSMSLIESITMFDGKLRVRPHNLHQCMFAI